MRVAPLLLDRRRPYLRLQGAESGTSAWTGSSCSRPQSSPGIGPRLEHHLPTTITLIVLFLIAGAVGAVWTIPPAMLKARYGLNEIITTLMMTFIGINLAGILVKGPFQDPTTTTPQTRAFDFSALLPSIPGTIRPRGAGRASTSALLVALAAAVVVWFLISRTSFGLRLGVLGASARSARHVGLDVPRLIVVSFLLSRRVRRLRCRDRDPRHLGLRSRRLEPGLRALRGPARLPRPAQRPRASSRSSSYSRSLSIGGDFAAQNAGLTSKFTLLLVGLTLLFMALTEWIGAGSSSGGSYLPGVARTARAGA